MEVRMVQLADLGEGIVEAEIVEWSVVVGDTVTPETVLVSVLTDKATVEVYSPVHGIVTWLGGESGDIVSVGGELVGIEVDGGSPTFEIGDDEEPGNAHVIDNAEIADRLNQETAERDVAGSDTAEGSPEPAPAPELLASTVEMGRPLAQPSVRLRAKQLDIDLHKVRGTGTGGRITNEDIDSHLAGHDLSSPPATDTPDTKIRIGGVRRVIAAKMSTAWEHIPHITYVDEVDVTVLESLRSELNEEGNDGDVRLTMLPFIVRSLVLACTNHPYMNATFDDSAGVVTQSSGMHVGIATQTSAGLVVPVVHHAERYGLRELAVEINSMAERARRGELGREELTGSTITVSSLGALGGLATTPIINYPEVAVVGVNKMQTRAVWQAGEFVPRKMINLSSSFDHRVVDGWHAAKFIQQIKSNLELPASILGSGER